MLNTTHDMPAATTVSPTRMRSVVGQSTRIGYAGVDEEAAGHHHHARHEPAPPAMRARLTVAVVGMRMGVGAADAHRGALGARRRARDPRRPQDRDLAPETPPSPPIPSTRFTEAAW